MYLLDMTRERSTRWAILGALTLEPMSGYDIRRNAAESWGHFWSESYGQIYPALRALETEGLVRARGVNPKARPGARAPRPAVRTGSRPAANGAAAGRERREFEITPRGRAALRRWQDEAPVEKPPRNELLLKLMFGANADPAALRGHVERVRDAERRDRDVWGELERTLRRDAAARPELPYWLATLSYGRHHTDAILRWCDETLAALPASGRAARHGKGRR